jgi:hypothetical protein
MGLVRREVEEREG